MSEVGELYVTLRAVTAPFRRSMEEAAVAGEESSGRIRGAFGRLTKIGVGVGAAALTIAGVTVKMAANFQATMERIHTQAGVAQSSIAGLSKSVLGLAGQVGFSPTSLAEGLYHVESSFASMHISGKTALEILTTAAKGAAIGNSDLVGTVNALDATIASGIPGVKNFSEAMGALNAIVGSGDMSLQDLNKAMGSGGMAVVKGYGLTIRDVGAALATFGDSNIRGAASMTALRMAVQALSVPAVSARKWLTEFGMSQDTLAKDMQHGGLKSALDDLRSHFRKAGISAIEQGQVITEMFGKKAGTGLAVLMGQFDRTMSKYPELTKGATGFSDAWTQTQKTFNQQLKETEQGLVAMGVKLGTVLLPYAEKFLSWLRVGVNWLTQHKTAVMLLAGALGTALLAAIVAVGGALVAAIGWAEVIAVAVMAAGAAAVYAYTHFKTFRTVINDIGTVLKVTFVGAIRIATAAIQGMINWFTQHKGLFVGAWNSMAQAVMGVVHWFNNNVLVWVKARIADLTAWWDQHGQQIIAAWKLMFGILGTSAKAWWDGVLHPMLKILASSWKTSWDFIRDTAKLAWSVISSFITMTMHTLMNVISLILDLITGKWGRVWGDLKKLVSQAISGAIAVIRNLFSGAGTLLWDAGRNIIKGLIGGIKSMYGGVKSAISDVVGSIKSHLPWSPAKEGPLSGSGSPEIGGRNIGKQIAAGLASSVRDVRYASGQVAGAAALRVGGHVGGVGGLAVAGPGGTYGSGVIQSHVTVMLDRRVLYKGMQVEALRTNRRNPTNGLSLTSR